ncbi:hypothetical protein GW17_00049357 [Ensete ventricosum]|nr:hypothetical protein GW17_00049357 [Ensete ventricosum]
MDLITHNRIYVCIGVSPCPVIVHLVSSSVLSDPYRITIRPDPSTRYHVLALPFCPHPVAIAGGAACRWPSPCPRAASFAVGAAALVGGRAHCPSGGSSCGGCARRCLPSGLAPSAKGAPSWALPTPADASHTHGRSHLLAVAIAAGGCAYWRLPLTGWPWATVPAGGSPLRVGRRRLCLLAATPCGLTVGRRPCRRPWPQPVAPAGGLVVGGRPNRWHGCGRLPLQVDSMQVAAPQPASSATIAAHRCNKCVEWFYVIQSHHTQFKTNFSHENLGSDTTVWKP